MTTKDAKPKKTSKAKKNTRVLERSKQRRRKTLTFVRMLRYGVNSFSRNAWLTVAATAVMSITLLIVFVTVSARQVLLDTVAGVSQSVDMSIYLKGSVEQETVDELTSRLEKLDNVTGVRYVSSEEARKDQAERYKDKPDTLEAIKEADNEMPATLRVSVEDLNDHESLDKFVSDDELYKENKDDGREPSFDSSRQDVISTIGSWVKMASIGGSIATVVFVAISSLVVFNTIRMAIFNRKGEIHMMKLIGAERSFIRGPFIVEAVMYGVIAAVVASALGYGLMAWMSEPLIGYDIPMNHLLDLLDGHIAVVVLGMIGIGSLIGVASSWVATYKYLKL